MRSVLLCLGVVVLAYGGCFSASEGETLKKQVKILQSQVDTEIKAAKDKRKQLKKVMEKATRLLTRNSADVGAQVERIQANNNRLKGQIQELQNRVSELKSQIEKLEAKVKINTESTTANTQAPTKNLTPDQLLALGRSKLNAGQHIEARKALRKFIADAPKDKRVALAQKLLGDSYYQQQKFAPAIIEYGKIINNHRKSKYAGHAYYRTGMGFYQLKFCGDALKFLKPFVRSRRYRRHSSRGAARKVLRLIYRYRRNKRFCSS